MQDIQPPVEFSRVLLRIKIPRLVEAPVPACLRIGVEEDQDVSIAKLVQNTLAPLDARGFVAGDEHSNVAPTDFQKDSLNVEGRGAVLLFVANKDPQKRRRLLTWERCAGLQRHVQPRWTGSLINLGRLCNHTVPLLARSKAHP